METTQKSKSSSDHNSGSSSTAKSVAEYRGESENLGNFLDLGIQSPDSILTIQQTLGNQAMLRLLNRSSLQDQVGASQVSLQRQAVIQRLPTVDDIQQAVDKDIAKRDKDRKKKEKAEAAKKKKTDKSKEDKSFSDAVVDSTTELVESVIKAVGEIIDKVIYDNLLTKLNEFHKYDTEFKKLNPAYSDHMERLKHIKEVEVASTLFISAHKEGDPGYKRIAALKKEAVDAYIKASPNSERAKQTRKELIAKKKADSNSPLRITDELIELMVMSVASPMNESSDKGSSGILGIQSAVDAADALMMVRQEDYDKIMAMLSGSGDSLGEVAQRATLLKALAARKADLIVAGPQTAKALKEMEDFAAEIHGMDKDEMVSKTHAADRGDGSGLQQRYTMSCGPTSIMITKGEFDPIYALKLSKEGKHGLAYGGDIAKEQQAMLESKNGANTALPREVSNDWKKAINAVNAFMATATPVQNANLVQYFNRQLAGLSFKATKAAAGKALAKTIAVGVDIDKRTPEWTKYYAVLGGAPGWSNATFAATAKTKLGPDTKRDFSETAVKYKSKLISGKTEFRGEIKKQFQPLDKALFRGLSVPFGVMWAGGGGHFMVFTDIKTQKAGSKTVKSYLVSDPWDGTSGWMSKQDVIEGKFSKIGASQGAIDSIYL